MSNFVDFAAMVAARWVAMKQQELFVTSADPDKLWDTYLAAFPKGTNEIFRERTEHDGSYDRNFIKRIGNVVAISKEGVVTNLWDIEGLPYPYNVVAEAMNEAVSSSVVVGLFRSKEPNAGHKPNHEEINGKVHTWHHFYGEMGKFQIKDAYAVVGQAATDVGVMRRGFNEIDPEAVSTVLDLIQSKALYRGDEFKTSVTIFQKAQDLYKKQTSDKTRNVLLWLNYDLKALLIRNTAIGTLLNNLSDGMELEAAVKAFETVVAPANYKRPTALVTPAMINKAMETVEELGLSDSLERRHAVLNDLSINDVLWADTSAKNVMKDTSLKDKLMLSAKPAKVNSDKAQPISIEDFMKSVLPTAVSIEVLLKNNLKPNLVSITAPAHADAAQLFKWANGFAWSYNGGVTDSFMRQEVQARGGSVSGVLRFTHSWNHEDRRNGSLMDLHCFEPGSTKIFGTSKMNDNYGNLARVGWNRRRNHDSGGIQDVDYVNIAPVNFIPVENITYPSISKMKDGDYRLAIHNWSLRNPTEAGFKAEVEFGGVVYEYDYPQKMQNKEWVQVATVTKKGDQFTIEHHLRCGSTSQELWGMASESFVRVKTALLSPNHWGDQAVGNKHYFFLLEGAINPEETRGVYNEYLRSDLEQHRKVFELVGAKTKIPKEDDSSRQLSGVGFSSTIRTSAIFKVDNRLFEVQF